MSCLGKLANVYSRWQARRTNDLITSVKQRCPFGILQRCLYTLITLYEVTS